MPEPPASRQVAAPPQPQAAPSRSPKHRDFKQTLARATPPATPGPARPAPTPAIARGPAPRPTPAIARPPGPGAGEGQRNAAFRQRIAEAERSAEHPSGGYGLRNPSSGALGRYQFVPTALHDIGWQDSAGNWTPVAQRLGVVDEASFLANPAAQEVAMSAFLARQEVILERVGSLGQAGSTITALDGSPITLTEGGMVAAAHRRGAGMLARYLAHRRDSPDAPLTAAQRAAFESVEARLRSFADTVYVSERPGQRMVARRGGPAV